jgi:hypothetical protein
MTQDPTICPEWIPTQYRTETFLDIVRSIEAATQAGPDRWGLRLDEDSLMLKVGPHEVLQVLNPKRAKLRGMSFHLIVDRDLIPARLRSRDGDGLRFSKDENCYGERGVSSYYPSNPGTEACDFEFSVLEETYQTLYDAHVAVIHRAAGLR